MPWYLRNIAKFSVLKNVRNVSKVSTFFESLELLFMQIFCKNLIKLQLKNVMLEIIYQTLSIYQKYFINIDALLEDSIIQ